MNKNHLSLLMGVLFFLTGCTLAPEYQRPEAPIPADWQENGDDRDAGTSIETVMAPELSWQEFFPDKKLRELINSALNNNRDLRMAALNVEYARGLYGIRRAELLPALNASGSGIKQRLPADLSQTGKRMTVEEYSIDLGINAWEIDFFGRIRSLKDQALESYLATEQGLRSAQILLVSSVADAYFALAADRMGLKLAQSTQKTQQSAYDLIQRRYEAGAATELDLCRAQTQLETSRRDVARYTQQVSKDINALNLLLGSYAENESLPTGLDSVIPPKEFTFSVSSEVLLHRPDILQAEHQLMGAYANIGAARAAFFPRISLTTMVGTASSDLSGLFASGSGTWRFAPQIVMPIFDARTWSAIKVSKVDREMAVTRYEKTIQTAFKEVADALAERGTIDAQVSAQQSLVNALKKIYQLSNLRYTQGVDSYLGVLDAQRSLYAAEQGLLNIRLAKIVSQVRLYAVMGGGAEQDKP